MIVCVPSVGVGPGSVTVVVSCGPHVIGAVVVVVTGVLVGPGVGGDGGGSVGGGVGPGTVTVVV